MVIGSAEFPADVVRAVLERAHPGDTQARGQVQRADADLDKVIVADFQRKSGSNSGAVQRDVIDQDLPPRALGRVDLSKRSDGNNRLAMAAAALAAERPERLFVDRSLLQHSHDLYIQYRLTPVQIEPPSYVLAFDWPGRYIPPLVFIVACRHA